MPNDVNISEITEEIKNSNDALLTKTIEDWFYKTRNQGLKLGAKMICTAGADILQKHIGNKTKPSLRDYKRATEELIHLFAVPIKQTETEQNNSQTSEYSNGEESSI